MDNATFTKILERARSDQQYAQALLLEPKRALRDLGVAQVDIDRVAAIDPETTIKTIVGGGSRADCGITVSCGETCTHTSSLPFERVGDIAGVTKAADCGITVQCTSTCTHTSSREIEEVVSNPGGALGGAIRGKLASR